MNEIMDIIIKLAGSIVGVALVWLCKMAVSYFKAKLDSEKLDAFVGSLVAAAEQLYKAEDEDGSVRLSYVQGMLIEAGYDLTDALRALIESKVYEINVGGESK